jgi:hypothetical protein
MSSPSRARNMARTFSPLPAQDFTIVSALLPLSTGSDDTICA